MYLQKRARTAASGTRYASSWTGNPDRRTGASSSKARKAPTPRLADHLGLTFLQVPQDRKELIARLDHQPPPVELRRQNRRPLGFAEVGLGLLDGLFPAASPEIGLALLQLTPPSRLREPESPARAAGQAAALRARLVWRPERQPDDLPARSPLLW